MDLGKSKMQQRVLSINTFNRRVPAIDTHHFIPKSCIGILDWGFMSEIAMWWLEYLLVVVGNQFMRYSALARSLPSMDKRKMENNGTSFVDFTFVELRATENASNHQNENVFPLRGSRWIYMLSCIHSSVKRKYFRRSSFQNTFETIPAFRFAWVNRTDVAIVRIRSDNKVNEITTIFGLAHLQRMEWNPFSHEPWSIALLSNFSWQSASFYF